MLVLLAEVEPAAQRVHRNVVAPFATETDGIGVINAIQCAELKTGIVAAVTVIDLVESCIQLKFFALSEAYTDGQSETGVVNAGC